MCVVRGAVCRCVQSAVDEEVGMVVDSLLLVLLECFTALAGHSDKIPPTLVSGRACLGVCVCHCFHPCRVCVCRS